MFELTPNLNTKTAKKLVKAIETELNNVKNIAIESRGQLPLRDLYQGVWLTARLTAKHMLIARLLGEPSQLSLLPQDVDGFRASYDACDEDAMSLIVFASECSELEKHMDMDRVQSCNDNNLFWKNFMWLINSEDEIGKGKTEEWFYPPKLDPGYSKRYLKSRVAAMNEELRVANSVRKLTYNNKYEMGRTLKASRLGRDDPELYQKVWWLSRLYARSILMEMALASLNNRGAKISTDIAEEDGGEFKACISRCGIRNLKELDGDKVEEMALWMFLKYCEYIDRENAEPAISKNWKKR